MRSRPGALSPVADAEDTTGASPPVATVPSPDITPRASGTDITPRGSGAETALRGHGSEVAARGSGSETAVRVTEDGAAGAARLVDAAAQALVLAASAANDNSGVSAAQLRVLGVVSEIGTINLTQLAEALHTAPSSASRLCDRLEAADLLRRTVDGRDRREVWLVLTSTARRLLDNLAEERQAMIAAVLRRMSVDQRLALVEGLQSFSDAATTAATMAGDTAQAS